MSTDQAGRALLARWGRAACGDTLFITSSTALMAIVALYALPLIFGTKLLDWYSGFLPALLVTSATLAWQVPQIACVRKRRFWYLLSLALGFWSLAGALRVFFPTFNDEIAGLLLEDALYLGYYLGFLFAIETRPHLAISKSRYSAL